MQKIDKIYRYLNLTKFIDLLQNQELFFSRIDKLRIFDKTEGSSFTNKQYNNILLNANSNTISEFYQYLNDDSQYKTILDEEINKSQQALKQDILIQEQLLHYYVNCWHINSNESYAMWKIYSDQFGLCIQSTFDKLNTLTNIECQKIKY